MHRAVGRASRGSQVRSPHLSLSLQAGMILGNDLNTFLPKPSCEALANTLKQGAACSHRRNFGNSRQPRCSQRAVVIVSCPRNRLPLYEDPDVEADGKHKMAVAKSSLAGDWTGLGVVSKSLQLSGTRRPCSRTAVALPRTPYQDEPMWSPNRDETKVLTLDKHGWATGKFSVCYGLKVGYSSQAFPPKSTTATVGIGAYRTSMLIQVLPYGSNSTASLYEYRYTIKL